jgi:hypothetical protein
MLQQNFYYTEVPIRAGLPVKLRWKCQHHQTRESHLTIDQKLELLHDSVKALAGAVAADDDKIDAHDRQIGALIEVAERTNNTIDKISKEIANLEKQWQTYINTLPKH